MEKPTIGIAGGGQLGRMLSLAAQKLGFKVVVLDPTPDSPAGQVADEQIVGSFKDREKIRELAERVHFLTYEIEGVNAEALEEILQEGRSVHPNPKILKIIRDKFEQKVFLKNNNLPVAEFASIESMDDCVRQGQMFGYPFLLKARFDAYDGRGNYLLNSEQEIKEAYEFLSEKSPLYAEKYVPFAKELAVIAAMDIGSKIEAYDVVETVHKNNICHLVKSPATIGDELRQKALNLSEKVLTALGGVGVFAIEMFLSETGELLVNEIAPRVHNSGHHTIESFSPSQFEQHIRAIAELPILKPVSQAKAAVMINILGDREGEARVAGEKEAEALGAKVHLYGKIETRFERKMGHITVLAETLEEAEDLALKARKLISI